jgi:hypothetical protein
VFVCKSDYRLDLGGNFVKAQDRAEGMGSVCPRYVNVCGGLGEMGFPNDRTQFQALVKYWLKIRTLCHKQQSTPKGYGALCLKTIFAASDIRVIRVIRGQKPLKL